MITQRPKIAALSLDIITLMKPMRLREIALVVAGLLVGLAIGIDAYATFFLPANAHRNGLAMFIANTCGLVGMILMVLIRAEMNRDEKAKSSMAGSD